MSRLHLRFVGKSNTPLAAPVKTGNPIIFGTAQVGQTLTASHGTYTGTVTTYAGQWYSGASAIALATSLSYVPVTGDIGNNITYQESASNAAGSSATGTSNALGPVLAAGSIAYDTAIGIGVGTDGIASLPLLVGGTVGSDLASGAPTIPAGVTYTSGTRTISNSTFPSGTIATWSGILTVGQTYVIELAANITSDCDLLLKDGSGSTILTLGSGGGFTWKKLCYVSFVATTATVSLAVANDGFAGTIRMAKIAQLSGALPAKRIWVTPGTGDDTRDGIDAQILATPLNSVAEAMRCLTAGTGCQVMVAENTTVTFPNFVGKGGYSQGYPTVIQTFDPADPTNETKYGRAYQRSAWVKVTSAAGISTTGTLDYFALRGFEFGNGNLPDQSYGMLPTSAQQFNYILIEACRFMYSAFAYDGGGHGSYTDKSTWAVGHIYRNNVFYGAWTVGEDYQGPSNIFLSFVYATYEDNINCHAGWKVGASRDDLVANGGTVISTGGTLASRKHPTYFYAASSVTSRRNFHADGCGDGGSWRGDTYLYDSLIVDCPTSLMVFGGDAQDVKRPDGRMVQVRGNAAIGASNLNTASGGIGNGIGMDNSQAGSEMWDNLIARGNPSDGNAFSFTIQASFNQPSYGSIHDNIAYAWTNSGSAYFLGGGFFPAQCFGTYSGNWSDDPTGSPSGTSNINKSARTYPNPYADSNALAAAAGFTDKATMIATMIAAPVAHHQRDVLTTLRTGYGLSTAIA